MRTSSFFAFTSILMGGAVLLLSGCKDESSPDPDKDFSGTYDGWVIQLKDSLTQQYQASASIIQKLNRLNIQVAANGAPTLTIQLELLGEKKARLRFDGQLPEPEILKPTSDICWSGTKSEVCYNGNHFSIEAGSSPKSGVTVLLSKKQTGALPPLEPPTPYKLQELVARAKNRSFESRIEFERVARARLEVENAYAGLIPRLTPGTIINIALGVMTFNIVTVIRSVGELAPFLLPSRWFKVDQAKQLSAAEFAAWQLMKADTSLITQGLGYNWERNLLSLHAIQENRDRVLGVRSEVLASERLGLMQPGSAKDIDVIVGTIDLAIAGFEDAQRQGRGAISIAAGFNNPDAVMDISIDEMPDLNQPLPIDGEALSRLAIERSLEIRQLDHLVKQARSASTQRYFSWLDPSGSGPLDPGLPSYIAIGKSQLNEIILIKEQSRAKILTQVSQVVSELQKYRTAHTLAIQAARLNADRVDRVMSSLRLGQSASLAELANALQERTRAEVDQVTYRYAYASTHARLERLIYSGVYADLILEQGG